MGREEEGIVSPGDVPEEGTPTEAPASELDWDNPYLEGG